MKFYSSPIFCCFTINGQIVQFNYCTEVQYKLYSGISQNNRRLVNSSLTLTNDVFLATNRTSYVKNILIRLLVFVWDERFLNLWRYEHKVILLTLRFFTYTKCYICSVYGFWAMTFLMKSTCWQTDRKIFTKD